MSDDFESGLDEGVDPVSEGVQGLTEPDELDMTADREDRLGGESQTDTPDEDLSGELFAYVLDDGTEIQGTVQDIAEKIAAAKADALASEKAALEAKVSELERGQKQPGQQEQVQEFAIPPVEWDKVGDIVETMLQGGDPERGIGGIEAIGPALQDMTFRSFVTDPRYAQVLEYAIQSVIEQREGTTKKEQSFKELVGNEPDTAAITAYQKAHPELETRKEVVLALQMENLRREMDDLKTGKVKEVKAAEKKGEAQTIRNLKAKGQLRRLGPAGRSAAKAAGGYKPGDENSRLNAWADRIKSIQGGG